MKKNISFKARLIYLEACPDAIVWTSNYTTFQEAWDKCERPDWMLWIAGKMADKRGCSVRKEIVFCACKCARTSLKYLPKGEKRPLKAILTAEAWTRGEATLKEVKTAGDAAKGTAYTDAAYAAAYASDYATAGDAANYAIAATAAKKKAQKKMCNIIRKHLKVTL